MSIRVLSPTGKRFTAHDVENNGTLYWVSNEGAILGIVGKSIAPYRILHVLPDRIKE